MKTLSSTGASGVQKLLFSYFSVLAVPILFSLVIVSSARASMTRIIMNFSNNMLDQSIYMTDVRLQELEAIPFYLESSSDLTRLLNLPEIPNAGKEIYDVYNAYRNFPKFSLIHSMIKDIQIVSLQNDFVISENNALRMNEQTFSALFGYTGMDYDAFRQFIEDQTFYNEYMQFRSPNGQLTSVVMSSISYAQSSTPQALVIIQLKEAYLNNMLAELLPSSEGLVFMLTEENELISSKTGSECPLTLNEAVQYAVSTSETAFNYHGFIVNAITSSYNGWKYYILSPHSTLTQSMAVVNRNAFILITLSLLMSFSFTLALVRHKAASLKKIVRYLNGEPLTLDKNNEFTPIANAASGLISDNQQLQQTLLIQKPLLDAAMLRNLLLGAINRPAEIDSLFATLRIRPDHQKFAVFLIHAVPQPSPEAIGLAENPILLSALVREYIEKNMLTPFFYVDMDSVQKAVILIDSGTDSDAFLQKLLFAAERAHHMALEEERIWLTFYASDIFSMVDDIPKAYNQTVIISKQSTRSPDKFLFSSQNIPEVQKLYYYPMQSELELVRLIKNGSRNELSSFLNTLKSANFTERSLSASMTQQFLFAVKNSLLRGVADSVSSMLPPALISALQEAPSFDELCCCILNLHQQLSVQNSRLTTERSEKQANEILNFISSNYADNSFTIFNVCEAFHMSESLAYQFFREVIGTSFADLLEQMRIEEACQMLTRKNMLIKEIALAVGYTSDNSFRRAFKRVMGITPGEYMNA